MRTNTRRRFLGRVLLTVLAVLGGLAAGALPAQATARYTDACPGFIAADSAPIRDNAGAVLGNVYVGIKENPGLACVATIKTRWDGTSSRTIARLDVYYSTVIESRWDDGRYDHYAGDPCTAPRPAQCSTRYAAGGYQLRVEGDMAPPDSPGTRYGVYFFTDWATLVRQAG
jgi:hypothetical protein